MKIIQFSRFGPPDVLQLKNAKKSSPGDNELLIKNYATAVTSEDCTFRKSDNFGARVFVTGLVRPKKTILGLYFSGVKG